MSPPPQTGPDFAAHATSVLDFLIKLGAALGAVWLVVTKIAKPYTVWRRAHYAALTKAVLGAELKQLDQLRINDGTVQDLCTEIRDTQHNITAQNKQIFLELNHFHTIAIINNERLDEINDFLDAIGFTSDRRSESAKEQRRNVDGLLARLRVRKLARDRGELMTDTGEHPIAPRTPNAPGGDD